MAADEDTDRLAGPSIAGGDPTGWLEQLYRQAEAGLAAVPWDRPTAGPLLVEWADRAGAARLGGRAVVVGCGLGRDAEFLAALGCATTAFDISGTAIQVARERHPDSPVEYVVADLFDLPATDPRGGRRVRARRAGAGDGGTGPGARRPPDAPLARRVPPGRRSPRRRRTSRVVAPRVGVRGTGARGHCDHQTVRTRGFHSG